MPFLTSLGCAIRRPSLKRTHLNSQLRTKLGVTGPLMVDSEGFALMANPGTNWTLRDVGNAIEKIEADLFVSLDFPPNQRDSAFERRRKIIRSNEKFAILYAKFPRKTIMPVVHGRTIGEIEFAVRLLERDHEDLAWVGFGGIVPLLQNRRVSKDISSMGAELFIAQALHTIRGSFPRAKIHVFGAGGTRTFPAVFAFGANSADSIGWRQAAGYGSIFLPLKSQREIRWNKERGSPRKKLDSADFAELADCGCPMCRSEETVKRRVSTLRKHFHNRSIHNAWVISNQVEYWPKSRLEMHSLI